MKRLLLLVAICATCKQAPKGNGDPQPQSGEALLSPPQLETLHIATALALTEPKSIRNAAAISTGMIRTSVSFGRLARNRSPPAVAASKPPRSSTSASCNAYCGPRISGS